MSWNALGMFQKILIVNGVQNQAVQTQLLLKDESDENKRRYVLVGLSFVQIALSLGILISLVKK